MTWSCNQDVFLHRLCGFVSIRSVNKEIFGDVFRVVAIEDLKLERTFAFVEKRGEAMEPYEMFKRFITSGYKS